MEVTHALLSVYDTAGLDDFAQVLVDKLGVRLHATDKAAAFLRERKVPVAETGALWSFQDASEQTIRTLSGETIQLVVVNLPPPLRRPGGQMGFDLLLEEMDLFGPTLVRGAMMRYPRTCVVMDAEDYHLVIQELLFKGDLDVPFCRKMARKALTLLARYEGPLLRELSTYDDQAVRQDMPEHFLVAGYQRLRRLASGTNRHQEAWLYRAAEAPRGTLATTMNVSPTGKLTMTRARDASLAIELLAEIDGPAAMILARQRPISVATAATIEAAGQWVLQYLSPALSSATIAFNEDVTAPLIQALVGAAMDMVVAPSFDADAIDPLQAREGLLLLATGAKLPSDLRDLSIAMVPGAMLVEQRDVSGTNEIAAADAGGRAPTEAERRALELAWTVAKYVRSDAVVITCEDGGVVHTVGIGDGSISRRVAIEKALAEARDGSAKGAVLASDGPITARADFERIAQAGITAVAHPGGPLDREVFVVPQLGHLCVLATNVTHLRY